jgi:hypothetical protein
LEGSRAVHNIVRNPVEICCFENGLENKKRNRPRCRR